jgi:hypothetical protein
MRKVAAEQANSPAAKPAEEVSILPAAADLFPAKIEKSALTMAEPRRLRDKAHRKHTVRARIDKSVLPFAEPKRLRDKAHLKYVASQPCLVCGRQPSDPHHLRFAQPRAIGMKVSDEFTVPLCRGHHRQLHQAGDEVAWWKNLKIDALEIAKGLWEQTHPKSAASAIGETSQSNDIVLESVPSSVER